ncbi:MAG: hypothetical protein IKE94_07430 [Aeriscardovia sp.]|nr:hypothetical protein [Aeriscardovia sp.]
MITKRISTKTVTNKTYGSYSYVTDKDSPVLFKRRRNKITGDVTYTVKENAWNNFINKIKNNSSLDPMEKKTMLAEAERVRLDIESEGTQGKYASARQGGWNRIDERSMLSRMKASQHEKLFANLGLSPKELADYLGVSVNDVMDENNWSKNTFQTSDGQVFEFNFGYDLTSAFTRIK